MEEEPPAEEMHVDMAGVAAAAGYEAAAAEIVVKLEPRDYDEEMMVIAGSGEVMDANFAGEEEDEHRVYEEISNDILLRAVSPPTVDDPEVLRLFYKERYQLRDCWVMLEPKEGTDKLAESFETCRRYQNQLCNENSSSRAASPQNSVNSDSQAPIPTIPIIPTIPMIPTIPTIPYQPTMGNNNSALPDFRFSVKSKIKLYHCVSCGKEYDDSNQLKQHAQQVHRTIYVSPKRIYKPRADMIAKNIRDGASTSAEGSVGGSRSPMVTIPKSQTSLPELREPLQPAEFLDTEDTENSTLSVHVMPEPVTRASRGRVVEKKEKVRCVLCGCVCTDIFFHMKDYHKVECLDSIINQCEKVDDDVLETNEIEAPIPAEELPMEEVRDKPAAVPVKRKRKQVGNRWIQRKRKFKQSAVKSARLPIGPQAMLIAASKKYKCDVCQGIYKTPKSFNHHRKLHEERGETVENFDPTTSRFLNSPLRAQAKSKEILGDQVRSQREPVKVQPSITNYLTPQNESTKPASKPEEPIVPTVINQNPVRAISTCECGRTFRNYHTLFLHKEKCNDSAAKVNHDSDSGVAGISIKIKKTNDDSYEVVPRTTPTDDNFKESRSCKDSDASSNDSGVVSVGSNSRKMDDSAKFKSVKAMRIRVEKDEEEDEVDIEDESSNQSNFNENGSAPSTSHAEDSADTASSASTENDSASNGAGSAKSSTLNNLCRDVLIKSKERIVTPHKCLTCRSYFQNSTDLMEHVSNEKHDVKCLCSCGKKFKCLKSYNIHVNRYHPLLPNCNYCKTNFDRIETYLGHKCLIEEGEMFVEPIIQTHCEKCKDPVDLGEPFDKHMKTHGGDNATPYQCYKCDLTFDNPYLRRSHFSHEHGFAPCRVCGKVLHIDHQSRHEAYHDGLGHPCHLCKKTFPQKTMLKKHQHSTHDPLANMLVECIVCLKSLKLRYLKKHMSFHLHTEICKKCNKCVKGEGENGVEEHMATDHPQDSPELKCDECSATFTIKKEYEEHCQQGSCKSNIANDAETTVQTTT